MARDGWGAPRIHGELVKLGFVVCEITVSRDMPRRPAAPHFRSGLDLQRGGTQVRRGNGYETLPYLIPQSLGESRGETLDRKLPTGASPARG